MTCNPAPVVIEELAGFPQDVRLHRATLLKFALRLTRNQADAEDLVQETMIRALARHDSLLADHKALSWMMTIMHNLFVDQCRRQKTETQAKARYRDVLVVREASEPESPPQWATVTQEEVATALGEISPKLREVYIYKVEGLSYQEIAAKLGVSVNTVGTRLLRARQALKKILSQKGGTS